MVPLLLALLGCGRPPAPTAPSPAPAAAPSPAPAAGPSPAPAADPAPEDPRTMAARERMVATQLQARDIRDPRVLDAMRAVPRHLFVPLAQRDAAYQDGPAAIGWGQTISQPYIVAFMTQALELSPGMRVLEIGTGSGYQAAVLSACGAEVWSIEIVPELARWADGALRGAGFPVVESDQGAPMPPSDHLGAVHLRLGDGYQGWAEAAPFDRIIVTAAPDHVPAPLREQVAVGGRLLLPVGGQGVQELVLLERQATGWREERILPVLFVPMTGEAQER